MTSTSKGPLTASGKLLASMFVLFAIVGFIDYVFYGQQLRNLLSGVGFSLLTYGALINGFSSAYPQQPTATYASVFGSMLLIAGMALRFLQ